MGQITYVSESLLGLILRKDYGIELDYIVPMDGGISDTTYRIVDRLGRSYFAKLYESEDFYRVVYELSLLNYLKAYGFPVAGVLSLLSGGLSSFVSSIFAKPFCVFEYIDGYSPFSIRSCHVSEIAFFLASFHNLSLGSASISFRDYLLSDRLFSLVASIFASSSAGVREEARDMFTPFLYIIDELDYSCDSAIIHGDLFPDNVHFVGEDLLGVVDFTSSCVGSFYFDIAVVVASWCMNGVYFSSSLFDIFINSYREHYLGDISLIKLFKWLRLSVLFFALQRYYLEKVRKRGNLNGKTYKKYLDKLVSIENISMA